MLGNEQESWHEEVTEYEIRLDNGSRKHYLKHYKTKKDFGD